jgi:hypothetical protein
MEKQTYKEVLEAGQNHFINSLHKLYRIGDEQATTDMFKYNVQYTIVSAQEETMRVMFGNITVDRLIEKAYQTYYKTNE